MANKNMRSFIWNFIHSILYIRYLFVSEFVIVYIFIKITLYKNK